jgi:cytochrome P450
VTGFPFPHHDGVRPAEQYHELVRTPGLCPVVLADGTEAVLVARHPEVKAVLSDDRFSREKFQGKRLFARTSESLALAACDPPTHTRRRRAVATAFTARRAREQEPWLRELAADIAGQFFNGPQPADLVDGFTVPFALRVITEMLGIPEQDAHRLRPLVNVMMSTTRYEPAQVAAAHQEVHAYFSDVLPDVRSGLLADLRAGSLTQTEIAVFGAGLLMAGYETTSNQLAMCAMLVFDDPALATRLRDGGVQPAIEEMLRWTSLIATGGAPHVALEDVTVGETRVRAGQVVIPLTDAANQDPAAFQAPGRFDAGRFDAARTAGPHLAFGHGRHFCPGAHLARAELTIGLETLLRHDLRLAVPLSEVEWRSGMFIRGPQRLPVTWTVS